MTDGRRRLAGRYRLDGPLGRGGMREVFHGYDERLAAAYSCGSCSFCVAQPWKPCFDRTDYTVAPPSLAWAAAIAAVLANVHRDVGIVGATP